MYGGNSVHVDQIELLIPIEGGQCPPGKEYLKCGGGCGDTCDFYVEQELIICAAYCYSGCFCPSGLITFRDRCVDPLECWSLINGRL